MLRVWPCFRPRGVQHQQLVNCSTAAPTAPTVPATLPLPFASYCSVYLRHKMEYKWIGQRRLRWLQAARSDARSILIAAPFAAIFASASPCYNLLPPLVCTVIMHYLPLDLQHRTGASCVASKTLLLAHIITVKSITK